MTKRNRESESSILKVATLFLGIFSLVSVGGQDLATDTRGLIIFSSIHDPRGVKLNWTNTTSPCSWRGITCAENRVTEVRLPGQGLRGLIPPASLSLLSELRVVSLRNNQLTGAFPGELGSCVNMESFYLAGNDFNGPLPYDLTRFWPRLTDLSLEYNRLNGTIPESIGLLSRMKLLNLRNNAFSGSIPAFNLANLTVFDVANNNLSGRIPKTLSRFPADSYLGNSGLCDPPLETVCPQGSTSASTSPQSDGERLSTGAIVGIVLGAVAFLVLALGLAFCLCRRNEGDQDSTPPESQIPPEKAVGEQGAEYSSAGEHGTDRLVSFSLISYDLDDLLRASAEVLGKGSVGTAYKAILEDGTIMVVKRLKDVINRKKDFESQIQAIGKLQHRNLVPLRAYYFSRDEKLLVSDFMPMGSLFALLHGCVTNSGSPIHFVLDDIGSTDGYPEFLEFVTNYLIASTSDRRVVPSLAIQSRQQSDTLVLGDEGKDCTWSREGLAHLHAQGGSNFVHGNIKSSNILLNRDLEACVSDFGLLHLLSSSAAASKIVGYIAPEVTATRKPTQKSDVYSFGVLLLELLTGKVPTQTSPNEEVVDLPHWVQSVVREEWTAEVFDLELMRFQNIEGELVAMLQIAMQCVDPVPDRRPKMNDVLLLLEDVHPLVIENGAETSRQSLSASEEQFRESDKDKDSQRTTPSHPRSP